MFESNFEEIRQKNAQNLKRNKRQAPTPIQNANNKDSKKNRCYLALVADHKFYKEIGNSDVKLTSAYLVNNLFLKKRVS